MPRPRRLVRLGDVPPAKLLEPTCSTLPCCTRSRTPARSRPTSPPGRRGASGTGRCGRSAGGAGCPRTPGGCGTPTAATRSATTPSRCRPSSRARPCRGGPRPSRTSSRRSSRSRRRPCCVSVDVRGVEEVDAELGARSMIAWLSRSAVCGPKFIVPRHSGETRRPSRPRWRYSTPRVYRGEPVIRRPAPGLLAGRLERAVALGIPGSRIEHERDVAAAPSRPAAISVASTPNASAAGPTIAKLSGTPAIEIIQSRRRRGRAAWTAPAAAERVPDHDEGRDAALGDERDRHRLPDLGDEPEPGRHQHPERPREIERSERALRQPSTLPERHSHRHRAQPAGAEHEPDAAADPQLVADDVGTSTSRPPRREQADRGRDERHPQPGPLRT